MGASNRVCPVCGRKMCIRDRHTPPLEGTPSYQVGDPVTLPAPDHPITGTIDAIEDTTVRIYTGPYAWSYDVINREQFETWLRQDGRNAGLFTQEEKDPPAPEITFEPVTVYPGDKNGLPYDVVVERLHIDETEPTPPEPAPPAEQAGHQRNTDPVSYTHLTRCSFAYNALTRPKWPVTTSGSNLSAM